MNRPLKKLTCACCGKSKESICIDCWAKDIEALDKRIKVLEVRK